MKIFFACILTSLTFAVVAPAHAAVYYENVQYKRTPIVTPTRYSTYQPYQEYQTFQPSYRSTQNVRAVVAPQVSTNQCLYKNAQGTCMIEQYYDPSNQPTIYYSSAPQYTQRNTRTRNTSRRNRYRQYDDDYYYDDYDDDYYNDYDYYDSYNRNDYRRNNNYFDFDRYFGND